MSERVGDVIRGARRTAGLSQTQLAQRMTDLAQGAGLDLDFTLQTVARLENGRRYFQPESAVEESLWWAAKALGVKRQVRDALGGAS